MSVPSVLDALPDDFFSVYWRRRPLLVRNALPTVESLISEAELDTYEDDYFSAPSPWRTNSIGRIGSISYIGNGECINARLAELCSRFRDEFKWPHAEVALVHNREAASWVTSGPHFDQVDNFITQARGSKQWRVWPTTDVDTEEKRRRVLRLPQYGEQAMPVESPDLVDVVVGPGDLLYLPLFWGHSVRALGPGIMLSINLKALLPSQVLLRGMAKQVSKLTDDDRPLPLPLEVPDWDAHVGRVLGDAFALVARRLAPVTPPTEPAGDSATQVVAAALADISSHRHEALLRREVADQPPRPSRHLEPIGELLDARVDLDLLRSFPPGPTLATVVEWLGAVHLHRFFGLLGLGPQDWWPADERREWAARREAIESADFASLASAAADTELIELTTRFRGDLLAFNRRHAVATLEQWSHRLGQASGNGAHGPVGVFTDPQCALPAEEGVASTVREALQLVDRTWPAFSDTFGRVIGAVVAVRSGWPAQRASRRPRIAVIDAEWAAEQVAEALVGELYRVSTQLVERIGVVAPGGRPQYRGGWTATLTDLSQAAALLAVAAYRNDRGDTDGAASASQLARELLAGEAARGDLTELGRALVATLTGAPDGPSPSDGGALPTLHAIVRDLEAIESVDARELVDGHSSQFARFRWSQLGSAARGAQGAPAGVGMDCGLPPWITS
ncbi:MAG TPA: cupin domain-containing protein [Candidatus Dormibacteraeota bacterium]|nr:cupin domain-containing protein [Candidatus Dormibacteraeota bacterium]